MATEPGQQADLLVNILAKIHDSASIVQSNQHAAQEALQTLEKARTEAAEVRATTTKLKDETNAYWHLKAQEIEDMGVLAARMRAEADAEFNRRVAEAEAAGRAKYDAWAERAQGAEGDYAAKAARLQVINGEVTNAQAVLDAVMAEVRVLRERLNV